MCTENVKLCINFESVSLVNEVIKILSILIKVWKDLKNLNKINKQCLMRCCHGCYMLLS